MSECYLSSQRNEMPKKSLEDSSWAYINYISQSGKASEHWQIGDTKNIVVSGETLTLEIIGFNHDYLENEETAGITFGVKYLMNATKQINGTKTNAGGFISSDIYSWLNSILFNNLPLDLQTVIKTVNKKTSAGNQSSTINTNAMKIFLFSEIEIYGVTTYSFAGEGEQYPIFSIASNRIKTFADGSSIVGWWERSPSTNVGFFCAADNSTKKASHDYADAFWGISFGFCI